VLRLFRLIKTESPKGGAARAKHVVVSAVAPMRPVIAKRIRTGRAACGFLCVFGMLASRAAAGTGPDAVAVAGSDADPTPGVAPDAGAVSATAAVSAAVPATDAATGAATAPGATIAP